MYMSPKVAGLRACHFVLPHFLSNYEKWHKYNVFMVMMLKTLKPFKGSVSNGGVSDPDVKPTVSICLSVFCHRGISW